MILSSYFLGLATGIALFTMYALFQQRRMEIAKAKFNKVIRDEAKAIYDKFVSIKDRLDIAQNITTQQLNIISALEQPQRNSMDGRHKQRLNNELKRLEDEKLDILTSILKDGHDPKMTIMNMEGQKEIMKLSEFLARNKNYQGAEQQQPTPEQPKKKLTLVKNEE